MTQVDALAPDRPRTWLEFPVTDTREAISQKSSCRGRPGDGLTNCEVTFGNLTKLEMDALEAAFKNYLKELRISRRDSDIWKKARRKIWWLIRLSQ